MLCALMMCAADDGEMMSIKLWPGNDAANPVADHIEMLDAALA